MKKLFLAVDEAKKILDETKNLAEELAPIVIKDIQDMEPFCLTEKISGESLVDLATRIFGETSLDRFLIVFKSFQLFTVDFTIDAVTSLSERTVINDQIIQILKDRSVDAKFTDFLLSITSEIFPPCANRLLFTEEKVERILGETFYKAMEIDPKTLSNDDFFAFNHCLFEHFYVMSDGVKKAFSKHQSSRSSRDGSEKLPEPL